MHYSNRYLAMFTYALIIIGAINWGLVGFFNFDLVAYLFGIGSTASRVIYSIVGLAAIVNLVLELTVCKSPSKCYTSD